MFSSQTSDALKERFGTNSQKQLTEKPISDLMGEVLQNATWYYLFLGHQVSKLLPTVALAEFMAALLNNTNCVSEMGSVACAMGKHIIDLMAKKLDMIPRPMVF